MTERQLDQGVLTRRASLALVLGALASCTAKPKMAAKTAAAVKKLAPPTETWPTLDALADTMVKRKLTPGLSLSVMHKGQLLYSKGFGIANLDTGLGTTPQTGFRIASITKQFTAASILLLAEDGKLKVTDPLARFLPDFPGADKITLRELMSHTSGMGDYINGQDQGILVEAQHRDYSTDDVLHVIKSSHPLYRTQPATAWLYSNSGFALLGIVVERASGMSYADFCEKRLFTPAGLSATTIDRTCVSATTAACNGYRPDFRAPHGFDANVPVSPSFIGGAGAIRSTTEDLCVWHSALLGGNILKPASLLAMQTPVLLKNGTPAMERRGAEPMEYGYGMGIGNTDGRRFIAHGGRVNGFTGHLRSYPEDRLTVAILYNSDGGGAPGFSAAQKGLRNEASRLGLAMLKA